MFVLSMYNVLPCMYCMKNYICCVRMQAQRCALRIELFMLFLLNLSSCYLFSKLKQIIKDKILRIVRYVSRK